MKDRNVTEWELGAGGTMQPKGSGRPVISIVKYTGSERVSMIWGLRYAKKQLLKSVAPDSNRAYARMVAQEVRNLEDVLRRLEADTWPDDQEIPEDQCYFSDADKPAAPPTVTICQKCGCDDVHRSALAYIPVNKYGDDTAVANAVMNCENWRNDFWCETCQAHYTEDDMDEVTNDRP